MAVAVNFISLAQDDQTSPAFVRSFFEGGRLVGEGGQFGAFFPNDAGCEVFISEAPAPSQPVIVIEMGGYDLDSLDLQKAVFNLAKAGPYMLWSEDSPIALSPSQALVVTCEALVRRTRLEVDVVKVSQAPEKIFDILFGE